MSKLTEGFWFFVGLLYVGLIQFLELVHLIPRVTPTTWDGRPICHLRDREAWEWMNGLGFDFMQSTGRERVIELFREGKERRLSVYRPPDVWRNTHRRTER